MNAQRAQIASFLLVAIAVYGGVHAYLWWRLTRQLGLRAPAALAVGLFFAAMTVAPFLGRLMRDGSQIFNAVELVTFLWMGIAFYLFGLTIGAEIWNLAARAARQAAPGWGIPLLGGPRLFWAIAAATALTVGWGAIEAAQVQLRKITIPTAKLAPGTPPVRIVQVSDIHIGLLVGPRRLGAILRRVREAQPDAIVATGDMLDAVGDHLEPLAAMWRDLSPRLGKYAITGNHEYYSGIPGTIDFLKRAGFRLLRDETAIIPGVANVVGREYRASSTLPGSPGPARPLADLMREGDPGLFTIVLNHAPVGFEEDAVPLGVDLQLSGHTHGGQLFPFRWLVRLLFRHVAGLYRKGDSLLYVSRGSGTWGPPLRVLAPPEVTLIELVPAGGSPAGSSRPGS